MSIDERLRRLERKVDHIQGDLERFATKEDLERFATKEDLERYATREDLERFATREDLKELHAVMRREMWAEMKSHFGAMEERMTHLFDVVLEAINSRLTLSEAEQLFAKRSELPCLNP